MRSSSRGDVRLPMMAAGWGAPGRGLFGPRQSWARAWRDVGGAADPYRSPAGFDSRGDVVGEAVAHEQDLVRFALNRFGGSLKDRRIRVPFPHFPFRGNVLEVMLDAEGGDLLSLGG